MSWEGGMCLNLLAFDKRENMSRNTVWHTSTCIDGAEGVETCWLLINARTCVVTLFGT